MLNHFMKKKLGDIANIQNGYPFKSKDFYDKGIPVIKIKSMASGKIIFDENANYPYGAENLKKYLLTKGDILVSMTGSHLSQRNSAVGKITRYNFSEPALLNQRVGKIYPKNDNCDNNFLYYLVIQNDTQEYWAKKAGGTANQANISPEIIKSLPITMPTNLEVQKKIASVLSAYDDLIENNEKRIKILEEMAERLYREWFVKFKFPGHEKARLIDSGAEYGKIPEGWEVKSIEGCFDVLGGGTPSRVNPDFWNNGTINWYTPTDITRSNIMFLDESSEKISDIGLSNSSAKLFPARSIMMTSRATIGAISINTTVASTNQGFIVCLPNDTVTLYYLFYWLRAKTSSFIDLASGATFKELSKGIFKTIKILSPDKEVLNKFEERTKPIAEQILTMQRLIHNLSKTRDLLIPKLVTGKREVKK